MTISCSPEENNELCFYILFSIGERKTRLKCPGPEGAERHPGSTSRSFRQTGELVAVSLSNRESTPPLLAFDKANIDIRRFRPGHIRITLG